MGPDRRRQACRQTLAGQPSRRGSGWADLACQEPHGQNLGQFAPCGSDQLWQWRRLRSTESKFARRELFLKLARNPLLQFRVIRWREGFEVQPCLTRVTAPANLGLGSNWH